MNIWLENTGILIIDSQVFFTSQNNLTYLPQHEVLQLMTQSPLGA